MRLFVWPPRLYLGPALKNVELPDEVTRKLPWGKGGSINDLRLFDWREINVRRAEITDDWNRKSPITNSRGRLCRFS
ncbi:Uncharacterised protein [Budvicia aquatica]|uniref:Uncharacterized protein n=1 Tax=Budvicia aquatica TaxID=82979 RepID=A0A484ZKR3_9GAMM|nr:Uncharacterised protein [Budvicia aquatica]